MKTEALFNDQANRPAKLMAEANTASDEMLLAELFRVFSPDHQGTVIVTHAQDDPGRQFRWSAEGQPVKLNTEPNAKPADKPTKPAPMFRQEREALKQQLDNGVWRWEDVCRLFDTVDLLERNFFRLPRTADGAVCFFDEPVWRPNGPEGRPQESRGFRDRMAIFRGVIHETVVPIEACYATLQAAKQASKSQKAE